MSDAVEVRAVRVAHALNLLFVLAAFAEAILGYREQPDWIPLHFDLGGFPDRWGPKSWPNALVVPIAGLGVTALLYGSAQLMDWVRRHPAMLNLPDKERFLALPSELQDPVWRQLKAVVYWLTVPETFLFATMARLRPGADGRLRVWPVFFATGLVTVALAFLTIRLTRAVKRAIAAGQARPPETR